MSNSYLKLYLVLDPDLCGGAQAMIETAKEAALGGATCVQLRAPHWSKTQMIDCGRRLKEVLSPLGVPLIVNNEADVCVAIDAEGLHIGQSDIAARKAREIIGPDRILGLSVTTLSELTEAESLPVDYYGIGPVFSTATKPDAAPPCGMDGLNSIVRAATRPNVAIGGIGLTNARTIMSTGTDGIAVVSAICGQKNPKNAARALLGEILAVNPD